MKAAFTFMLLGGGLAHARTPPTSGQKSGICPAPNPRDTEISAGCRCDALTVPELAPSSCTNDGGTRTVTGIQDPSYDPTLVDWRSLSKSVEYIAGKEPRVCNMAIRGHFHDALSHLQLGGKNYGSDGSLTMDAYEFTNPVDSADAFAYMTRVVVVQLSYYYGASLADILNVVAFTCVRSLGAIVPIPEQCASDGLDLMVGKLDAPFEFTNDRGAKRTSHLPGGFDFASFWLNFFFVDLNSELPSDSKWRFKLDDSIALMGSHGNIQDVTCMSFGSNTGADFTSQANNQQQCSGAPRVFAWSNEYFQDANSGMCTPRAPASNAKGTAETSAQSQIADNCTFKRAQTQQLRDQLVCSLKDAENQLGIPPNPSPKGVNVATHQSGKTPFWRHVDWAPNPQTRADCCGYVCPLCQDNSDAFYCAPDAKPDTTYWPYTWNDCDLAYAAANPATYCNSTDVNHDCPASFLGPQSELETLLSGMQEYYTLFANDNKAWQEAYARGHCKMNNYGATYSNKATKLLPLLSVCKAPTANGGCASDPAPDGTLRPPPSCGANNCKYNLNEVVTPKTCLQCAKTATPSQGELASVFPPPPTLSPNPGGQKDTTDVFGGMCAPKPASAGKGK